MNLGIYRSWHGLGALAVVAALLLWHTADGAPFGSRGDDNVGFLLATGWIAVAMFAVLALYAVRRAAHRLRLSPEFVWKAKLPDLERAQSQLAALQAQVDRREVAGRPAIRAAADRILRRCGVHRVLRVGFAPDPQALGAVRLQAAPREPLGRLASWLHAHVYYGTAAAFVVWFHGGGRSETTMGLLLNALSWFVIGSGLLGALLWTFGPRWLTRAEREVSVEKAFALRAHYAQKHEAARVAMTEAAGTPAEAGARRDELVLAGQRQRIEREWRKLGRLRALLRGWRLLHVPCSVLLLALVFVHVLSIWYY